MGAALWWAHMCDLGGWGACPPHGANNNLDKSQCVSNAWLSHPPVGPCTTRFCPAQLLLFMILSSLGWNSLLKLFSGPQCVFAMKQWRYATNFRFSLQTLTFHYRHWLFTTNADNTDNTDFYVLIGSPCGAHKSHRK